MTITLNGTTGIQNVLGSAASPAESNTTNSNTGVYFPTSTTIGFSTAGTNAVYVDASQNVGINTTFPSGFGKLASVASTGSTALYAGSSTQGVYISNSTGTDVVYNSSGTSAGSHVWKSGATELARLNTSGTFLVGTSSGTISLVPGSAPGYTATITLGGSTVSFDNTSAARDYAFTKNTGGSYATVTAVINNVSDYRLKENITPFTNALLTVAQLKPSKFNFKADIKTKMPYGESTVPGFIAHELAEVMPYAVRNAKDEVDEYGNPKYQGVDTSFLVATLTAAIQEQQALITQLTDRIAALEAR